MTIFTDASAISSVGTHNMYLIISALDLVNPVLVPFTIIISIFIAPNTPPYFKSDLID